MELSWVAMLLSKILAAYVMAGVLNKRADLFQPLMLEDKSKVQRNWGVESNKAQNNF